MFNLVENALDSLEHAIKHLTVKTGPSPWDYKRVIIDLAHVAELLFKERLRRIHPAFVLENIDKFPSSAARTVSAADAINRLARIGHIDFEPSDISALKTVREIRNEIEHYEFRFSENESKVVIGNVLVFIFKFSLEELDLDWAERRINDPRWIKLNEYASFYEAQKKHLVDTLLNSEVFTIICPVCHNDLFDTEAEVCLLCGHREEVFECNGCKSPYINSDVQNDESGYCPRCEWQDGFAAANFEKY